MAFQAEDDTQGAAPASLASRVTRGVKAGGFTPDAEDGMPADQNFGILQRAFAIPAAANREGVRELLRNANNGKGLKSNMKSAGEAYTRGANDPSQSETFQDQFLRETNAGLDKLGVGNISGDEVAIPLPTDLLPEGLGQTKGFHVSPQSAVRFTAGLVPSAAGVAADMATNPAAILTAMAIEGTVKGLSKAADPALIPKNPNFFNTFLKGNKFFSEAPSELAQKATDAFTRGSNYIKQNFGKIKQGNSQTFGTILDNVPSAMSRANGDTGLTDAMYKTLDYYGKDPNTVNTPGYQALKTALKEHDVNTAEFTAAKNKAEVFKKLSAKAQKGEFVDPDEIAAYKLTPEDRAVLKAPKHADDVIDARDLQEIRRSVRKAAGADPLSKAVADGLDMEIGHNLSTTQPGLQDALTEYRPVLQAKYRALQKFKPNEIFDTGGERFLRGMAVDEAGGSPKAKISDTDRAFMETLAHGNGPYQGVGSGGLDALDEGALHLKNAYKIKDLHAINRNAKIGAVSTAGVGLYKSRLLLKLLGHD